MPRRAGNVNTRRGGRPRGACAGTCGRLPPGDAEARYFAAEAFWASWKAWAFSERCTSFVRNSWRTAS